MKIADSTLETVEMSEIDGIERGAVLRYMAIPKKSKAHEMLELNTCVGDLYIIVNALYDYAGILERVAAQQASYQQEKGSGDDTGFDGLEALLQKQKRKKRRKEIKDKR